jgi:hypothetical protein
MTFAACLAGGFVFTPLHKEKRLWQQKYRLGGSTGQSDWSDPSSHMAM